MTSIGRTREKCCKHEPQVSVFHISRVLFFNFTKLKTWSEPFSVIHVVFSSSSFIHCEPNGRRIPISNREKHEHQLSLVKFARNCNSWWLGRLFYLVKFFRCPSKKFLNNYDLHSEIFSKGDEFTIHTSLFLCVLEAFWVSCDRRC